MSPYELVLLQNGIHLPFVTMFLGSTVADCVTHVCMKTFVFVTYFAMVCAAIYGIVQLRIGADPSRMVADDSYYQDFYMRYRRDFLSQYGPVVMVAFTESLDYTDARTLSQIYDVIESFRRHKHFISEEEYAISWIHSFRDFLESTNRTITSLAMPELISILMSEFVTQRNYEYFSIDVNINTNMTEILSSRILLQTQNLASEDDEREMLADARSISDDSPLAITLYSPRFLIYDQFITLFFHSWLYISTAVGSVLLVSFILIPSISAIGWLSFSTLSISVCTLGFMALWNIELSVLSLEFLIIGLEMAIMFSAHITYHYVISLSKTPRERARDSLFYLGAPLIQGVISMLFSVCILAPSTSYITQVFFRIMVIMLLLGFYHALFLLPVLLSTLTCLSHTKLGSLAGSRDAADAEYVVSIYSVQDTVGGQSLRSRQAEPSSSSNSPQASNGTSSAYSGDSRLYNHIYNVPDSPQPSIGGGRSPDRLSVATERSSNADERARPQNQGTAQSKPGATPRKAGATQRTLQNKPGTPTKMAQQKQGINKAATQKKPGIQRQTTRQTKQLGTKQGQRQQIVSQGNRGTEKKTTPRANARQEGESSPTPAVDTTEAQVTQSSTTLPGAQARESKQSIGTSGGSYNSIYESLTQLKDIARP